jgi:hypothetical protein
MPRYLTKSKFKLAMECPTKLFYTGKPQYANQRIADNFLAHLADGGFQVGELARCYFPNGIRIETPNDETAVDVTDQYLADDNITLFEAGFRFGTLLIRADIVEKRGDILNLYEVKAKSCDFDTEAGMLNQNQTISSRWKPYVEDVAFQKYVIGAAYPALKVSAHLMLIDKTARCPNNGLNQKFRLVRDDGRRRVQVSAALAAADLDPWMLRPINVDATCETVYATEINGLTFAGAVNAWAENYDADRKMISSPSSVCKECEFRLADGQEPNGRLSGYRECWSASLGWIDADFGTPTVLDIWDYRKKDPMINAGKIKMTAVEQTDIAPAPDDRAGLSRTERQWKQVEKVKNADPSPWIDLANLEKEMQKWAWPLHFIDFETSAPVLPFQAGRRPYEGIAFQFSHHTVDEDGTVRHQGQFLDARPGTFPNYDFIRALKSELEGDNGTIFRYHSHENSFLAGIRGQILRDQNDIPDRDDLVEFIQSITKPRDRREHPEDDWEEGPRSMVDLFELVKRYDYNPAANGSISLKYVLPAALNISTHLQQKYSQPIYGADGGIRSRNFKDQAWVERDANGRVRDPYTLLPPLFTDEAPHDYAVVMEMDRIKDGGAAMTAYCKLQFEDVPSEARLAIESALLKYCELDTLAMVMIYESWKALL